MSIQDGIAFFHDDYVPLREANVNVMTHSFMYGTAVFEGIRAYWNAEQKELYVFRLREHFERMVDSMKIMHLETKYSIDQLCEIVKELMRRNKAQSDMYIRPAVYKCGQKIGPGLDKNPSDIVIITLPFGDYFAQPELKVQVSSWRRVEDNAIPARAKIVGAYVNTALAITDAHNAGFDDSIVLTESGHVSEGSAMNLFMVKNGKLYTPSTTENILEGITRNTVMEMVKNEFGWDVYPRSIDRSELYTADEIFCCGTGAQITPIIEIDKRVLSGGKAGPITCKVRDAYIDICRGKKPAYQKWLSPVYKTSAKEPSKAEIDESTVIERVIRSL
jgi:branched-chain amino acid aminotransferase